MTRDPTAVFLVQRVGPYHHARLCAWVALRAGAVHVIEFRTGDAVYAWDRVKDRGEYERIPTRSSTELKRQLALLRPDVIVCVGYADPEINQAMAWALQHRVPLVTCSDSTFADEPRFWAKEMFKRQVVRAFDAALVAGTRAREYLQGLGLADQRQFRPWDVVDNAFFAANAELSRKGPMAMRAKLGLPAGYFLCVARFVPKKNLRRLIEAYARYALSAGREAWSLVLSGAGPEEPELRHDVTAAGLKGRVYFPGFLQYADLPAYYGLAGALVLPSLSDQWGLVVNEAMASGLPVLVSSRCGCAPDLVCDGENGFTFDPDDVAGLAGCLTKMAAMDPTGRTAMGQRSREIVAAFTPAAFAGGLEAAINCALHQPCGHVSWRTWLAVNLLARRTPPPQ